MSKKQPRAQAQPAQSKHQPQTMTLAITPQIAVGIQGAYPEQELFVEVPNGSGTRHKVVLTEHTAYKVLINILMEKAGGIELQRQLNEERANGAGREHRQPDWRLIAKHPMAEIRQGLIDAHLTAKGSITVLPTRAAELMSNRAEKSLEDMGL